MIIQVYGKIIRIIVEIQYLFEKSTEVIWHVKYLRIIFKSQNFCLEISYICIHRIQEF